MTDDRILFWDSILGDLVRSALRTTALVFGSLAVGTLGGFLGAYVF